MELYIGGRAQGKLSHVLQKYENPVVFDERDFREKLDEKVWTTNAENGTDASKQLIWNHFHLAVKALLAEGWEQEQIWNCVHAFMEENPGLVIIADEIGSGIVPMERDERIYRETTGRLLCRIAKKADSVERIICGIPQKLK